MRTPPPPDDLWFSNKTSILQKKAMWFIGVEVEQETSAPPPKKNPGSAPENPQRHKLIHGKRMIHRFENFLVEYIGCLISVAVV